jgi:hypothetical protein
VHEYDRAHTVCFTDLYEEPLKRQLEEKYGEIRMNGAKTEFFPSIGPIRCGELIQNLSGTIRGDWFYGPPPKGGGENLQSQGKTLSLVNHYVDYQQGVISVGGTITTEHAMFTFTLQNSGRVNLDFKKTKAGEVYCYQAETVDGPANASAGRILVELVSERKLKAEHQDGICDQMVAFTAKAKEYIR